MDDEALHRELEQRFDALGARCEELRADAEARVATRRWASVSWLAESRPFYLERNQLPRSRMSDRRPEKLSGATEYGYDEQERPVLVREYAYGRPSREEYFTYEDGRVESCTFELYIVGNPETTPPEWQLVAVARFTYDAGRLVGWDRGDAGGGWKWERYHYGSDGRLERISDYMGSERWESRFVYDADGELAAIRRYGPGWDGSPEWRRPPRSLKPALAKVEDTLVDALARWAREHWPAEPVYCFAVGLSYEMPLSPAPGLGADRERQAVLAEPDECGVGLMLWNPAEFETFGDEFDPAEADDAFAEAKELLVQEWDMTGDDDAAVRLLLKVAKRLAAMDWSAFPTTPDFVVLAVDFEIEDQRELERYVKATAPKEAFKALKKQGLLHVAD